MRKSARLSRTLPPLDATQQALIAQLDASREAWHGFGRYAPERSQEHPAQRLADGVQVLERVPHAAHAAWTPPKNRPSPVDIVVAGNAGRQEQYVPLRMGRMAASPFAFLRGAAAVMAWDLSHTPVSGIQVAIDGDAHINNFGLYGTPQRDVIIDLNDFDEATIGPWEWDLKRLVASVNVAGRENGMSSKERRRAVRKTVTGYRLNMQPSVGDGHPRCVVDLRARRTSPEGRHGAAQSAWDVIQKTVGKAKRTTNASLLPKVAQRGQDGAWRFKGDPPILTRVDDVTRRKVIAALVEYGEHLAPAYRSMLQRYTVADVAHRVVGVGSVGTRAYLVLCFGNGDIDPLFLQVKEAIVPVHAAYLPPMVMREQHEGRRVVGAQRLLQSLGDPLLGYTKIDGRDYFVRQMKNMKASMPVSLMTGRTVRLLGVPVRGPAGALPCALRRCRPHRGLLRRRRHAGSRVGGLRRGVRRPDRA